MVTNTRLILAWCLGTIVMPAVGQSQEAKDKVAVGAYAVTLQGSWNRLAETADKAQVIARKIDADKKPIADMLAAKLRASVVKESSELIESIEKQPTLGKVVERQAFETKAGQKGRSVLITLNVKNEMYGEPLAIFSIYLPTTDGASVTIKLLCNSAELAKLRPEFEAIVKNAQIPAK